MLIDASFGFEMETFEFLNICQVHGFPRIMGVLTHLDSFKNNKVLRKTKKNLKHRFWTEVYQVEATPPLSSGGFGPSDVMTSCDPAGRQAVLPVWDGLRGVPEPGGEEPGPLHLRHQVPPSAVANVPPLRAG